MAYRLKLSEPLVKGVRRIASEQLANAATRLQAGSDPQAGVHEARKSLKRTRALLRLIRPSLGKAQFRAANGQLRDIARSLSAARDRDVVRGLLIGLKDEKPSVAKAAASLLARVDGTPTTGRTRGDVARDIAKAVNDINAVRHEIADISFNAANFDAVVAGLVNDHRSGRKALALALDNPQEEESLHDLRKAAQAYWRQMTLIQQAWPDACLARAAAAKNVADLLGRDHDVALIDAILAGPEGQSLTRTERNALLRVCAARHEELRGIALPRAQLLFAEKSQQLGERLRELWAASRRAARSGKPNAAADATTTARKSSS